MVATQPTPCAPHPLKLLLYTGADLGSRLPGLQPGARAKNSVNKFHKNLVERPASPVAHPDGRKAQQPPICPDCNLQAQS